MSDGLPSLMAASPRLKAEVRAGIQNRPASKPRGIRCVRISQQDRTKPYRATGSILDANDDERSVVLILAAGMCLKL
jgi:hypothetical protein